MNILIGADIDPKFKRAFQSANKEFKSLGKVLVDLRKKSQLVKKFEMNTDAVEKARGRLSAAQKQVMSLRREMNKNPTKKLSSEFETAKNKSNRLSESLDKQRRNLRDLSVQMGKSKLSTKNYREENKRLSDSIDRATRKQQHLARLTSKKRDVKQGFSNMRGKAMGMAAAGVTAGVALMPGEEFEYESSVLQAKTPGMTGKVKKQMMEVALGNGRRTDYDAPDVLRAMTKMNKGGMKSSETMSATPAMVNLAVANKELGLEDAADIATNTLSSFQMPAKKMGMIADVLTATAGGSNTDILGLSETLGYAGAIAGNLERTQEGREKSFKEVMTMAGLMGDKKIESSRAGTSIAKFMTVLSAPNKPQKEALNNIGVTPKYTAQEVKTMRENGDTNVRVGDLKSREKILRQLYRSTKDMGGGDQLETLRDIFGQYAVGAVSSVVSEMRPGGKWDRLYGMNENSEGATKRSADIMLDNFRGARTRLGSAFKDLGINVFKHFQKSLTRFVDGVSRAVIVMSDFVKEHPNVTKTIGSIAAGMMALAAGGLVVGVAKLTAKLFGLKSEMSLMKFTPLAMGFKGLFNGTKNLGKGTLFLSRKALPAVATAIKIVSRAMFASPIGLVASAFVGAAVMIYKYWKPVKSFFSGVAVGIKAALAPVADSFKPLVNGMVWVKDSLSPLFSWFNGTWSKFTKWLNISDDMRESSAAARSWGEVIGGVLGNIVRLPLEVVAAFGRIPSAIAGVWSGLTTDAVKMWDGFAKQPLNALASWPADFFNMGKNIVKNLIEGLFEVNIKARMMELGASIKHSILGGSANMPTAQSRADRSGMKRRIMESNPKGTNPFAENAKSRDAYFANFGKKSANDNSFSKKTAGIFLAGSVALGAPQLAVAKPQIEARPIVSNSSNIVTDNSDRSVHLTINQLPGEDSEKLANRVADLVDKKKKQSSSGGLYDGSEY